MHARRSPRGLLHWPQGNRNPVLLPRHLRDLCPQQSLLLCDRVANINGNSWSAERPSGTNFHVHGPCHRKSCTNSYTPLTGATPVLTPTTSTPSLVNCDLRQGVTRNGSSSASLRISDPPAPEPDSSSAPIMIDQDGDPIRRPADEPIETDSPTQTLPTPPKTATALDPQGVQGRYGLQARA